MYIAIARGGPRYHCDVVHEFQDASIYFSLFITFLPLLSVPIMLGNPTIPS